MYCETIKMICTIIGGVAGLISIIKSVKELCVWIWRYFRKKKARPVDQTGQAS